MSHSPALLILADAFLQILIAACFIILGLLIEEAAHVKPARNGYLNCALTAVFMIADTLRASFLTGLIASLARRLPLHGLISFAFADRGHWLLALPLAFFTLLITDFFYYWMHRLQHASKWLWVQHQLHHTDEEVNITTSWRDHWLESPLQALFIGAPLAWAFQLPVATFVLASVVTKSVNYFIHLNVNFGFGHLNRLFSTPQTHRIHHSKEPRHFAKNFASAFSLWDTLFGTYYHPQGDWPITGIIGESEPTLSQAMMMPFTGWKNLVMASVRSMSRSQKQCSPTTL